VSSYYGRPVLKEPVWQPEIPWYFFTGGLAGASGVLSLVARLSGNETLARRSLYVGAAADLVSPALLVSDLGRPERFLNMFRVFKVTSPMSVGSWILGVSGGASTTAALLEATGKLKPIEYAAELVSALVLAGEAALRWSVFKAGFQSARDPKYTVDPQRERVSRQSDGRSRTQPGSSDASV